MQKSAIIIGKILPYLGIALTVEMMLFILGQNHFHAAFHKSILLLTLSLIFLLATSGLGALISSFSTTQTQAVQFSVFFLLPVFLFPLTYFCHACREINVYSGGIANVAADLILLSLGALVTCLIANLRLRQTEL